MLTKITVADYMSRGLVTLSKETNVIDAIQKLLNHRITCAPVIDQHGHLVGMFSEKDGMRVFLDSVYNQGMSGKVGDYMSTSPVSIDAEAGIVDVAEKFQSSPIRNLPVLSEGELVGVISRTDILRVLVTIQQ